MEWQLLKQMSLPAIPLITNTQTSASREQEQELKPALTQFRSKPKMFSNSLAYLELISMRVRIQSLITNC